jgi:hypothetical protein
MMKVITKTLVILIILSLTIPTVISTNITGTVEEKLDEVTIRIAQYPYYAGCDQLFNLIFNYQWNSNGTVYTFNIMELTLEELSGNGKNPLNIDDFDLLLIGASFDSFYKHGADEKLINNIKNFVSDGGGYLSVCAGTVFSTQGYENPNNIYEKYINNRVLKIANVYLNLDLYGEAQYIFKMGQKSGGLVPIEDKVVKNTSNPIFKDYPGDTINISYGGGPGLYPADIYNSKYGKITPLLVINEELMETKPIHWYKKGILPGWIPSKKVKTDFKGQYGAIASTYGDGRIVIFNCHPEINLVVNGTIDEYMGKPSAYGFGSITIPPIRVVFSWTGTSLNMSYNWWIHRRAAAWIAGVPDEELPPVNELMVFIDKPMNKIIGIYLNDKLLATRTGSDIWNIDYDALNPYLSFPFLSKIRLGQKIGSRIIQNSIFDDYFKTVIIGDITVDVYSEGCEYVEFYIDDELVFTNSTGIMKNGHIIFTYKIDINNFRGIHNLKVIGYDSFGNFVWEESDYAFFNS